MGVTVTPRFADFGPAEAARATLDVFERENITRERIRQVGGTRDVATVLQVEPRLTST